MSNIHLFNIDKFFSSTPRISYKRTNKKVTVWIDRKIDFYGIHCIIYHIDDDQFDVFSWTASGPQKRVIVDITHEFHKPIFDHMIKDKLER